MSGAEAASLALLLGFLVLSAFFSSSEAAFLSLQRTRIAHLLSEGVPGARRVANMLNEPERLLSTILLGNNLVNVAFSAIITVVVVNRVGQENEGLGVVIATILGTVTLLLLGETIPKTIAFRNSERIAFLYSYPLKWGEFLLLPFVLVLQWITKMLSRRVGGSQDDQRSITEGEFRALIDIGVGEGEFEQDEAERLKGVFRFGDRQVRDVMTPRTEIVFVQRGSTVKEFLTTYAEHSHTRFPVYWDTTDNVVGVLSLKDILRSLAVNGLKDEDSVTNVIRDVHFVPETKRIAEVFDELRKSGNQMAIAVDEFGGVAGLVTLKQLIEDVMGRVGEEGVGTEEEMTLVGRDTYEVDGGMSIDEARDRLELGIEEGDFETVAGWALERLGHIPAAGETFEADGFTVEIIEMDNLKIETLRLTKNRQARTGGGEE
ncbi:MAG: HlyC/CorC family transporter [Dehalococcoidia bacterium]|nr:HlyC/CorC family transporter [Dehalococcoidia bacterium]